MPRPRAGMTGRAAALVVLIAAISGADAGPVRAADGVERAEITVIPAERPHRLTPFATNIVSLSNAIFGPFPFEPIEFRTMFAATGGEGRRIYASRQDISGHDTLGPAVFAGGLARVFRVEDGRMRLLREGRIAPDGFEPRHWAPEYRFAADVGSSAKVRLAGHERRGVPYWFTIATVDAAGRQSAPGPILRVDMPREAEKRGKLRKGSLTEETKLRFTDGPPSLPAPSDFTATVAPDGSIVFSWAPVEWAAGYVILRADAPLAPDHLPHIAFAEDGPEVRKGDLVMLSRTIADTADPALLSNRTGEGGAWSRLFAYDLARMPAEAGLRDRPRLLAHAPDSPVENGRETYLSVELSRGEKMGLGLAAFGGSEHGYYHVLDPSKTYRAEMWLRADRLSPVRFDVTYFEPREVNGGQPMEAAVDTTWRKVGFDFTVGDARGRDGFGHFILRLAGPGRFDVDNFVVFEKTGPPGAMSSVAEAHLAAAGMGAMRIHATIKTRRQTYDLETLTAPPGSDRRSIAGTLANIARLGSDPWLQVEPHFTHAEWLGLVEYLAAPFDPAVHDPAERPWAARRHAAGQAAPWTEVFDRLIFEVGNEMWNGNFGPWASFELTDQATGKPVRRGAMHGMLHDHVLAVMRTSPWWDRLAPTFVPVIGGRTLGPYGYDAIVETPDTPFHTSGAYISGQDGQGREFPTQTPSTYGSLLARVLNGTEVIGREHLARARAAEEARGTPVRLGVYEGGPGYFFRALRGRKYTPEVQAEQDAVMKSAASGIAALDSFMTYARLGFELQAYFLYKRGREWASHYRWEDGGHPVPAFDLLAWANNNATGEIMETRYDRGPVIDMPHLSRYYPAVEDGPLIGVHATREGERVTLMLLSRRVPDWPVPGDDGVTAVRVNLPFTTAERLTVHRMTGAHDDTNDGARRVAIVAEPAAVPDTLPAIDVVLPPGSARFLVFEGVD